MIPSAPFTPVGVSDQCNSGILGLSRQSSILIEHWLIVTPTGIKGEVGIIFDIDYTWPNCQIFPETIKVN